MSAHGGGTYNPVVVAIADAPAARPPSPEECSHPAPLEGVMAHEFAHYDGAIGPEGKRRTVTYYGPVVGGLPIQAWHCEVCGLLRLSFPDGRREERHLFPGPQPGLLALPAAIAPEHELFGLQARVSGLSAPAPYYQTLIEQSGLTDAPAMRLPQLALPAWDGLTWITVIGLTGVCVLLFVMAVAAVGGYSTPSFIGPLGIIVALSFVTILVLQGGAALIRALFPVGPLAPSVVERLRPQPVLDGATKLVVTLLVLALTGLFTAGVLAVYSYATPGAEGPIFVLSIVFALLAIVVHVAGAISRRLMR